jgi:hypothetical protein
VAIGLCAAATLLMGVLPNVVLRFGDSLELAGVFGG